ncbi:MAG: hypothetical protein PVJ80_13710 [Gemmatimonadota bacterium]
MLYRLELIFSQNRFYLLPPLLDESFSLLTAIFPERHQLASLYLARLEL